MATEKRDWFKPIVIICLVFGLVFVLTWLLRPTDNQTGLNFTVNSFSCQPRPDITVEPTQACSLAWSIKNSGESFDYVSYGCGERDYFASSMVLLDQNNQPHRADAGYCVAFRDEHFAHDQVINGTTVFIVPATIDPRAVVLEVFDYHKQLRL